MFAEVGIISFSPKTSNSLVLLITRCSTLYIQQILSTLQLNSIVQYFQVVEGFFPSLKYKNLYQWLPETSFLK